MTGSFLNEGHMRLNSFVSKSLIKIYVFAQDITIKSDAELIVDIIVRYIKFYYTGIFYSDF